MDLVELDGKGMHQVGVIMMQLSSERLARESRCGAILAELDLQFDVSVEDGSDNAMPGLADAHWWKQRAEA